MELKRIGEFCRLRQGFQVPLSEQETEQKGGYVRFIRIVDYTQETTDIRYIKDSDRFYYVKEDDVVMVRYGAAGEVGHGITGVIANNLFLIEPLIDINKDYLYYFLAQSRIKNKLLASSASTTMPALNFKIVNDLEVPIYDKHKQDNIVSILNKLSSIICKRQKEIIVLDELIKARFVELFGDPDLNPMGWNESLLSEKLDVLGGYAFKSDEFNEESGIPVLRIGNINAGYFRPVNMVYWHDDESLERYAMYPGDLVMSLTGTVGKEDYGNVCILGNDYDKYYLNQRNAKLEIKEDLDKLYLSEILKFENIKKRLTGISRGVRQANIANRDILNLCIPVPPMDKQKQFADFVEQVDKSKVAVQKSLEETQLLFDSLMQQYFG